MKKIIVFSSVFFGLSGLFAQNFSGNIEFKYATQKDTTHNIYIVKNKSVRLDQYGKKGNIEGSFLFDLAGNEVKFLNPKRKLWGFQKSETPQVIRGTCISTKGSDSKTISGIKCVDYTVKNTDENTTITYWIAESKYPFFAPLVKLWNRKDRQSIYFGQIKGLPEGSMPLLSEERQVSDNKLLTKLEVVKFVSTPPTDDVFAIPEGYTKFDQE
ncbi:hypothetical protein [Aurantibacillus circumpalustris]|uniref:hypothetical protein n=1 Tax=Aurantibacillus circumpalustris TaxID=3036359 RepID=UPI00295AE0C6|nr:hypothetical protein [Aurantibacillus circumpalustris]